ncbi:Alpha/Beta hydrolase protein [Russula brevipes]|nr:Alpha/Beta hydrolase protein [Russula brevipes]
MSHHTIPRPRQSLHVDEQPLPGLHPLRTPTEPLKYPALPSPSRDGSFAGTYSITTHIIPAAFPRVSPFVPVLPLPNHENRDERGAHVKQHTSELLSLQAQDDSGTRPKVLWSVLNRYVRTDTGNMGGLTLLLLHANGLHKETFEPTLRHLLQAADQDKQYQIDEIWALDAVQHGDSGLINAQDLGALFNWGDQARDILNFVLHFLPETVMPLPLPACIPRVAVQVSEAREKHGFAHRKLVVVGHSFGGCAAILAAHSTPAPFSELVLVDPVISPLSLDCKESIRHFVVCALTRRSVWPSREEAYTLLSKSPFFGTWDPDVLRTYVDYALVEDSSGRVSLKCTSIQEAVVFADGKRSVEAWLALPQIDNRIAIKWLVPSPEASILKTFEIVQEAVWRRPENSSNSLIPKAGHAMIQDSPRDVAQGLHEFLLRNSTALRSNL